VKTGTEVIEWIHSLLPFGIKPGLKRMEWMLERLEHPEQKIKAVHIGGTNGKGSTVSFMRHVLEQAGYKVGTFTSPYIECFEERISINGTPIEEAALVETGKQIRPLVDELTSTELGSPTEFEVITTIAFYYFATIAKPDIVLLEVGLGGRFDSTNVITPLVSVITSIGFDHMHILGETLPEITSEKAGIIKPSVPIVSGVSQKKAQEIIGDVSRNVGAPYTQLGIDFKETLIGIEGRFQVFSYEKMNNQINDVTIQMSGPHQRENAAVAIRALEILVENYHFDIPMSSIHKGLRATTWIGRFEQVSEDPLIVIDGAHNKEGMESLEKTLTLHYPDKTYRFLLAATKEKDMGILLKPFEQLNSSFTFTSFDFFRAAASKSLYEQAPVANKRFEDDWEKALEEEVHALKQNEMLIVAGSLYFISSVRGKWLKE
jgi:dihydrofolate synthase/folylpolyglutamate synthase